MTQFRIAIVSAFAAALVLGACAGGTGLPPAQLGAESPSPQYRVGPGDTLEIFVWREEELSVDMPVRPDGVISVPLVGDITAEGKTPAKLARELEGKLADFIQVPQVTIIVSDSVGSLRDRIRVIGSATEPRVMAYRVYMTMLDVLIAIGGLSQFADGNGSILIRREDSQRKQYCIRLDDLLRDGDMSADVDMIPGDVLIIPLRAGSPRPQE